VYDDAFRDLPIPPELEASLRHHREHLAQLVVNLRSAGIHQSQIETSVSIIMTSYEAELVSAIKRLIP
jgi:hypothetical protein